MQSAGVEHLILVVCARSASDTTNIPKLHSQLVTAIKSSVSLPYCAVRKFHPFARV